MIPLRRIAKALTNRSPRDVAHRATQLARAKLEYYGLGDSAEASVDGLVAALGGNGIAGSDELLARFRDRVATQSLPALRKPEATVARISKQWPELPISSVERAERVARGQFDLLGFTGLDFGNPVDWSLDPINQLRAPSVHWTRVPYLDPASVGDHKIVWELNRHQFFLHLGQAAWLSGDPKWGETFFGYLDEWMAANPPKMGINWTSSLEVAFRSISWLWALHFFVDSPLLTADRFARIVAHLRAHGRHVEHYISTSFSPNTHLTGEALALVYLGSMIPELPEAARWRKRGRGWLLGALNFHINPDGGYFEQSLHYHQYTADFYTHLVLLYRWFEGAVPAGLEGQLEHIVDHLAGMMKVDGTTPLVGDDDGGRLLFLDDRAPDDVRSTIQAAAVVLNKPTWATVAGAPTEALVWLLGPEGLDRYEALRAADPASTSKALLASRSFPDTGLHVMRSQSADDEDFTLIRCGPAAGFTGGHSHADSLAIDVTIGGHALLIDPGTASYMDREQRERFRSTAAHNTVTVDGRSSSEPSNPFGWAMRAQGTTHQWLSQPELDYFEGSHDGFERLAAGLRHDRSVLYVRGEYWVVRDRIHVGADANVGVVRAHFQFAPGLSVAANNDGALEVSRDAEPLANVTALRPSRWVESVGAVAPVYGRVLPAPAWISRVDVEAGKGAVVELVTLISRPGIQVRAFDASGGGIWEVGGHLLACGSAGQPLEGGPIRSDFDLIWARPSDSGEFATVFASRGANLALRNSDALRLDSDPRTFYVSHEGRPGLWLASGDPDTSMERAETLQGWLRGIPPKG